MCKQKKNTTLQRTWNQLSNRKNNPGMLAPRCGLVPSECPAVWLGEGDAGAFRGGGSSLIQLSLLSCTVERRDPKW